MGRRFVSITTDWCHICGLTIPKSIVCSDHPLFGTVDHVIPISAGGQNVPENCRAAHRWCNRVKGPRPLESLDRCGFQGPVKAMLERIGIQVTRRMFMQARERIKLPVPPSWGKGQQKNSKPVSIQRWEDDGGMVKTA